MLRKFSKQLAVSSWQFIFLLLADYCLLLSPAQAASHAIAMYGDVKYPANFKHFDYVNPNAPKRGTLVMPEIGTFDSLNPYILKGTSAEGLGLTTDTLMTPALDETSTNYGLVAQSADVSPNNDWVVFNINPAAKFNDGSAITADDVIYTFGLLMEKGHPIYKLYYGDVGTPIKLGALSVKFPIKNPANRELKIILGQLPVLSKAYYEKHDFTKTTLQPPLSSGPYVIEKVDQGRSITYKRNPKYWAANLPVNIGRYNFDKVRYEYYRDPNVAIQAFKAGAVDLRYENIAKNWANAYNIPQIKNGKIIKEKIKHEIPQGMQSFVFNLRKDKFDNVDVRKAIGMALDFEWMNKNLFFDSYTRSESFFSNSIYAAKGAPSGKELELLKPYQLDLPEEVFNKQFELPKSDGSGFIRNRLLEAKELLKGAGWIIKNGKLKNYKDDVFTIEVLNLQGSSFERVFPSFEANLKLLGIDTKIVSVDPSSYKKRVDDFDFDMMVSSFGASLNPGNELVDYWDSKSADIKGSRNIIGVKNPIIDELVKKIINAKDKETLIATTRALDRVLMNSYYVIPQWHIPYFRILYWNKFARPEVLPKYDSQFGLWTWWAK
jgi:microcin C transport system substrate-binding protein